MGNECGRSYYKRGTNTSTQCQCEFILLVVNIITISSLNRKRTMIGNKTETSNLANIEYGPIPTCENSSGDSINKTKKWRLINIGKRIAFATLKLSILLCFLIFVVGPIVFKFSYTLQRNVIFLNFVNWPKNPAFNEPSKYIDGTHNFYVETDDNVRLGVWQILPSSIYNRTVEENLTLTETDYFDYLDDGKPVIVYYHGNAGHRAAGHRIELYKVLRKYFHVIAFDYRGYGDSSDLEPTERGIVNDCLFIYKWVLNKTRSDIFVWGHSLGTGLSTHMLAILSAQYIKPKGLILESPFNNLKDEIRLHPMSKLFKDLPWFHYTVIEPMQMNNFSFETDKHILKVDCPILILHAEDDLVVPYDLGYKLYKTALEYRRKGQGFVRFKGFDRKFSYGHKYLCRAPELDEIVLNFMRDASKDNEIRTNS